MEWLNDPNISDSEKVKLYLQNKGRDRAEAQNEERQAGLGWAQFAAGLGDAMAGRSSAQTAQNFDNIRKSIKDNTVGEYDRQKNSFLKDLSVKRTMEGTDATSMKSQNMRKAIEANFPGVAKQYGDQWQNVAADDLDNIFKPLQLKENIDARKETARILAADRAAARQERNDAAAAKLEEKEMGLKTPYGLANTVDDAKQLKEAHESKKNFDAKIQEMIQLRKDNHGGSLLNREAVSRGKQLSKDLLLEYKNMAKLGVLSKSDEDIINAIIPEDPLAFNSPLAAIQGQDPILHKLEKFKGDSDRDFQTRIGTRTRAGIASQGQSPQTTPEQKTVVKTQTNQKTGEKRIVYSDGTTEIVPSIAGGR